MKTNFPQGHQVGARGRGGGGRRGMRPLARGRAGPRLRVYWRSLPPSARVESFGDGGFVAVKPDGERALVYWAPEEREAAAGRLEALAAARHEPRGKHRGGSR